MARAQRPETRRALGEAIFESMTLEGISEMDLLAGPRRGQVLEVVPQLAVVGGIGVAAFALIWASWAATAVAWAAAGALVLLSAALAGMGVLDLLRARHRVAELARRVGDEQRFPVA
jgi:uncharacterized membrane protein